MPGQRHFKLEQRCPKDKCMGLGQGVGSKLSRFITSFLKTIDRGNLR